MKKARSDLAYLCRSLKAPALLSTFERLADRARSDNWTHEEFLAACLEREVASRQTHGGENRIKVARFPSYKTLEGDSGNRRPVVPLHPGRCHETSRPSERIGPV